VNLIQVEGILQQTQERFQTMSDHIIRRIDDMSKRVDDLEKSITDLMGEAGVALDDKDTKPTN
jgi:heat shock factor-binding protein 1